MKSKRPILIAAAIATLFFAASPAAFAVEDGVLSLEVLVNGAPLGELPARGTTYIEAVRHAEYALRLRNRTGRRLAVALAVDGLNTIDAKTTDPGAASKWVIDPWQTITIEGWQIGPDAARKFFFTSEDKSYGAWLGKTSNLGVIEAVAFREFVPPPRPEPVLRDGGKGAREGSAAESAGPKARIKRLPVPDPCPSDDLAATGIGRKIDNPVQRVQLQLESHPATHLRLRYEYRDQLVSLGVLVPSDEEQALARRERARGFEGFEFAPDPWDGR